MLLTVSNDRSFRANLSELLEESSMFSYQSSSDAAFDILGTNPNITAIIFDARLSKKAAESFCKTVKSLYPSIKIATVIDEKPSLSSKFLYIAGSDDQLVMPASSTQLSSFLFRFYERAVPKHSTNSTRLHISSNRNDTTLLGYSLKLTPSENRILLLLSTFHEYCFTKEQVAALCFPERSVRSVPVHICNINKKAGVISERALILDLYGKGYILNKNM